jgi:hypothetical protein
MNDTQRARDYANQEMYQAQIQIFNENSTYTIEGEEAKEYLVSLFKDNFPKLRREAMQVATTCAEEMAISVIAQVCEVDPALLANLRKPYAQAVLLSGQQIYAETGDPDKGTGDIALGQILSKMVSQVVIETDRGFKDRSLKRAIDATGHLSRQHINTLSVLAIISALYFNGDSPAELISSMDNAFSSYRGDVVTHGLEYSYLDSVGVGTLLIGTDFYQTLHSRHRHALRRSFRPDEIPTEVDASDRETFLEPDPQNADLLRLRAEKLGEILGSGSQLDALKMYRQGAKSIQTLRKFVGKQIMTAKELKDAVNSQAPDLFEFLEQLGQAGAHNFHVGAIGLVLAKQELDLRFPGSDLLGPLLAVEAPNFAVASEPRSE